MDKAAAIAKIRKQLTEGNIEAALQLLIENIEPERQNLQNLSNRAIQTKVQLEKTQKDELQGVISFENSKLNYNQLTQQVISLVNEWEKPSETPALKGSMQRRKFTPKMILVAIVVLGFIGITILQMLPKNEGNEIEFSTGDCPEFDPESFNIMVLPYSSLRDPESTDSPHRPLATRLDRFKKDFSGNFKTRIASKDKPTPKTDEDAIRSAEECQAELVIWGEYEHLIPADIGTIVTTNYKYLAPTETFEFTMLNLDEDSNVGSENNASNIPTQGFFVDTIQNYSAIINKGELTDELENQFRLLFGVAVMQSGNPQEAVAILEQAESKDSSSMLLKDMALAESHLKTGDKNAAVKAYDQVLETHPNYWFAINNRAMLYYERGDYTETLETLDRKLKEDPDNINALTVRGAVRIKTQQLKEAEEDLRKAESLSEQKTEEPDIEKQQYIRKKIDLLEREKATEKERIIKANDLLARDKSNLSALADLAEANRNLGDYEKAGEYANRILNLDSTNAKAIAVKLETAAMSNNVREVTVIKKEIRQLDTASQNTMLEQRPILRKILELNKQ